MLFTFNEKVKIINGFYEGQTGTIVKYSTWFGLKYKVTIGYGLHKWFTENQLDSLDFPNKRFDQKLNKLIK